VLGLGSLAGPAKKAVDNGKSNRRVYLKYGVALESVHVDDGQGGRGGYGSDEFLVGELVYRRDMNMDKAPEVCRKACGGKPGKSLMHDRNGTYLFLGKLVGALKIIDFYLPGISGGTEIFRLRITGVNRGKKLINLFLR
jgi:hypothetical protein